VQFVQAEGHATVCVYDEPKARSTIVAEVQAFSFGILHEKSSETPFGKVSLGGDTHRLGWVGLKNIRIMNSVDTPDITRFDTKEPPLDGKRSRLSTASTDIESAISRLSISSLESADVAFDSHSAVQYHVASIETRYTVDMNMIAKGAYGKVYKAEDRHCPGRVVAIKRVLALGGDTAANFMEEAEIMQDLDHPGICKIFEVYQDGDVLYFVLEFLEGGDLFDKITSERFSEETAADIIKQIACALKYAHLSGVAHRDLKPENICFCNRSTTQVKVIDWGLSSDFWTRKMKSSVGSPNYSAPEVQSAQGKLVYSSACDLWSLGVLTYVMLCGKPPFWGRPKIMLQKMQAEQYPMQNEDWVDVSDSTKDFIRCLLKANPDERMTIDEAISHPFLVRAATDDEVTKPRMAPFAKPDAAYHVESFISGSNVALLCNGLS